MKALKLKERKLMQNAITWKLVCHLYSTRTGKIRQPTCSLNFFELWNIHLMNCHHHKFQNKRIKRLINCGECSLLFSILLSISLICNLIKTLILLSKVSWNIELAFGIATCVCCSNNVNWDIFIFKVSPIRLKLRNTAINGHNNNEGIRQAGAKSQVQTDGKRRFFNGNPTRQRERR